MAIVSPLGQGTKYAGTATDVGIAIARAVRKATSESIRKWSLVNPPMDLLSLLERKGVTMDDLWAMAGELRRSETSGDPDDLRRSFVKELERIKEDANVNALVQAAMLMDAEGDRDNIRGLKTGEFRNDPAHLVADKMLGAVLLAVPGWQGGAAGISQLQRKGAWMRPDGSARS